MAVLGVDFGNWYGYVSFVQGANQKNRGAGICQNLVQEGTNGIPTVIYHNCIPGREREAVGNDAVRNAATPVENRVRLLKHHLQEKYTLPKDRSGRYGPQHTFEYDEAIKKVLKYMIDRANGLLVQNFPGEKSTNEIYLAYPGRFGPGEIQYFINLAQQVRLDNGKNIVVKGTIAEPAAAALDYLSEEKINVEKATVMTIDEGAGTLDVAMVTAYPGGKPLESNPGQTVYYEIHGVDGDMNAGGARYDERIRNILHRKVGSILPKGMKLTLSEQARLDHSAEEIKISLTDNTRTEFSVEVDGDFYDGVVTREEFEKECEDLIDRLGNVAKSFYERNRSHRPDCILLTGGAARMPMVMKKVEEVIPEMRGKIRLHNPSRAISYGAARYGALQTISAGKPSSPVVEHTARSLGVGYYYYNSDDEYISTFIPGGTEKPFTSEWHTSYTRREGQTASYFAVWEAVKPDPNPDHIEEDWRRIMEVTLLYNKPVPKGSTSETRLILEKNGTLTIESRKKDNPSISVSNQCVLTNINSEVNKS